MMCCPSVVGAHGHRPGWNVTSRRITSGMNVPAICSASSPIAARVAHGLGTRKSRPISTSHHPMIET